MKKVFLMTIMMLLCVGCEAKYNITFNDDLSVKETINATEDKDFFDEYENSSMGRVVGFILEPYLNDLNKQGYNTDTIITSQNGGVSITNNYKNFDGYKRNTLLSSQFTDKIEYEQDGDIVTISAKGAFSKDEQNQDKFPVEKGTISITLPFKVKEHNADKVSGNTYTWEFDAIDTEEEELKIVFDSSRKGNENYILPIIIISGIVILVIGAIMVYNGIKRRQSLANRF